MRNTKMIDEKIRFSPFSDGKEIWVCGYQYSERLSLLFFFAVGYFAVSATIGDDKSVEGVGWMTWYVWFLSVDWTRWWIIFLYFSSLFLWEYLRKKQENDTNNDIWFFSNELNWKKNSFFFFFNPFPSKNIKTFTQDTIHFPFFLQRLSRKI